MRKVPGFKLVLTAAASLIIALTTTAFVVQTPAKASRNFRSFTPSPTPDTPGSETNPKLNPCTGKPFVTIATNAAIKDAQARMGGVSSDQYVVSFTLDTTHPEAQAFTRYTEEKIGQPLAIVFDGEVLVVPVVQNRLTDGGEITGQYTLDEVKLLALQIRAGALPFALTYESVTTSDAGLRLIFSVPPDELIDAQVLAELQEVLKRRLTEIDIPSATFQWTADRRFSIDVPGTTNPQAVADAVGRRGLLEFVDFSGEGACKDSMPIAGDYILTNRHIRGPTSAEQ